jgi:hypothetical protein
MGQLESLRELSIAQSNKKKKSKKKKKKRRRESFNLMGIPMNF